MKKILLILLCCILSCIPQHIPTSRYYASILTEEADANNNVLITLPITSPSAILMEASTGTVLFEKNAHQKMAPASITKIMTLILIFEAIEMEQISLNDTVVVSEHAASMGGSQVFLEVNETQTVNDLIKCISIASANDACVAMAEHICGSEDAFVQKMNEKAVELGMENTNFINCCGLEAENHYTCAYDIALMSQELSLKHPQIHNYCTIWMDSITHVTQKGTSEFGLTNTNKLIRYYPYATGLKTGYTSEAKYCLSATACKDNINLISVVMACNTPTDRTKDSIALLNYGFSNCNYYTDSETLELPEIPIIKGTSDNAPLEVTEQFSYVLTGNQLNASVERFLELPTEVTAPIECGDIAGKLIYKIDGTEIGSIDIIYTTSVPKKSFYDTLKESLMQFILK